MKKKKISCNHIVGLATPRYDPPSLKHASEDFKWRGRIFLYCPDCGEKIWELKEFTGKRGKYKQNVYIGNNEN